MLCPICKVDLKPSDLGEFGFVVVDRCPKCSGMWLDKTELDRVDDSVWINAEELAFRDAKSSRKIDCPKCRVALSALSPEEDAELEIDRCPTCHGFWLDKGELDHVKAVVAATDDKATLRAEYGSRPAHVSRLRWTLSLLKAAF